MVEVRVLGPVELVDAGSVVRLAPTERTLLAALASRLGQRVAAEVLEDALWPDDRPPSARKTLQGHVMRLRRALGASAIVERTGGYRLDPDLVDVDAARVSEFVGRAREASRGDRPEEAIGLLREAGAAFRGDPYADVPDTAVPAGEVPRLDELRWAIAEETFEAELTRGSGAPCIGDIEALLERQPLRERAWGHLMLALYQAGRAADALAAYGRARVVLASELGLEPGPALKDLERSILSHDPRLRRHAPIPMAPSNLPAAVSPIIGRDRELADLAQLCEDHRLVTLTGIGGIGKTRLALELGARAIRPDEHGPYFVDLVPIGEAGLVPSALSSLLGLTLDADEDAVERIRSALAGDEALFIVDNCEHLLPEIAEVIVRLLASAPGVRVVTTCRQPLDVAGEQVWPLDPLGVPPALISIDGLRRSESGALFLAAVPRNVATGALGADDVAAVARICRRLDGVPLALELAAARTRTMSLSELADRLDHSIGELARSGPGPTPRHRSLRSTLDWGFQLLSPPARVALSAMHVFVGGCELPAFGAVCGDDGGPVGDALIDELVRTSFVTVDVTGERPRYRLLEPIRQYAGERLDAAGDHHARRDRHLRTYGDMVRELVAGEDDTGHVPLDAMSRELGNLRAALDWAAHDPARADAGLRLATDLYHLWTSGFHHVEGLARITALVDADGGTPAARAAAARTAAVIAAHTGDADRAVALCQRAIDDAVAASEHLEVRRARRTLAQIRIHRGELASARELIAPELSTLAGPMSSDDARCLVTSASIDLAAANLDDAEAAARQVLAGNVARAAWTGSTARWIVGQAQFERGDVTLARAWFAESVAFTEHLGHVDTTIDGHLDLVLPACAAGRVDDAHAHLAAAAGLRPDSDVSMDLRFLCAGAELALFSGRPAEAIGLAQSAMTLADRSTLVSDRCRCLRVLGDAQLAAGDPERAVASFEHLIVHADVAPYPCRLAEGHEGAAAVAHATQQPDVARHHLGCAAEIRRRTRTQRLRRPVVEELLVELEADSDDGREHSTTG